MGTIDMWLSRSTGKVTVVTKEKHTPVKKKQLTSFSDVSRSCASVRRRKCLPKMTNRTEKSHEMNLSAVHLWTIPMQICCSKEKRRMGVQELPNFWWYLLKNFHNYVYFSLNFSQNFVRKISEKNMYTFLKYYGQSVGILSENLAIFKHVYGAFP